MAASLPSATNAQEEGSLDASLPYAPNDQEEGSLAASKPYATNDQEEGSLAASMPATRTEEESRLTASWQLQEQQAWASVEAAFLIRPPATAAWA